MSELQLIVERLNAPPFSKALTLVRARTRWRRTRAPGRHANTRRPSPVSHPPPQVMFDEKSPVELLQLLNDVFAELDKAQKVRRGGRRRRTRRARAQGRQLPQRTWPAVPPPAQRARGWMRTPPLQGRCPLPYTATRGERPGWRAIPAHPAPSTHRPDFARLPHTLYPLQADVRDEPADVAANRMLSFLQLLKFPVPTNDLCVPRARAGRCWPPRPADPSPSLPWHPLSSPRLVSTPARRDGFTRALLSGSRQVVYPILAYLLSKLPALKKRAYVARYLMPVEVPPEFAHDEAVADMLAQYRELQLEFKETHKAVDKATGSE
jgi:hypothetical protein